MKQFQSLSEVLSALRRRIWLILALIVVGCALSLYYALNMDKVYEATAVIQKEEAQVPEEATTSAEVAAQRSLEVRLIEQRIMARDTLLAIMQDHGVFADAPGLSLNERIFNLRQAITIRGIINEATAFLPGGNQPSGIVITVRLGDPEAAAALANDIMNRIIALSRSDNESRARETYAFFASEEQRVEQEIAEREAQIAAFKAVNADMLPEAVAALRGELADLRADALDIQQEIGTLQAKGTQVREEVRRRELAILAERRALVEARRDQIREEIASAPEIERRLGMMERSLEQLQLQYENATRRKSEAEIETLLETEQQSDRFEVLETALIPEYPVSRSRAKTAIMGGILSVFGAMVAGLGFEMINPRIRTPGQMERMLGIEPVIAIPVLEGGGALPGPRRGLFGRRRS